MHGWAVLPCLSDFMLTLDSNKVNSVERGRGSGRNMKAAKEEAAKVAAINLGFPGF